MWTLCIMMLTAITFAQNVNEQNLLPIADAYISRALTNWRIPGAAVLYR